jgi:hypothetical protein
MVRFTLGGVFMVLIINYAKIRFEDGIVN